MRSVSPKPFELTNEETDEMIDFFNKYDRNTNGQLELDELQKLFASMNVIALKDDIEAFFDRVDKDKDGTIDFDELMVVIEDILAEKYNNDDIIDAFSIIDEDGSGSLTNAEVADAMEKADVGISQEDIIYLLEEADVSGDGLISFSEFRSLLFGF